MQAFVYAEFWMHELLFDWLSVRDVQYSNKLCKYNITASYRFSGIYQNPESGSLKLGSEIMDKIYKKYPVSEIERLNEINLCLHKAARKFFKLSGRRSMYDIKFCIGIKIDPDFYSWMSKKDLYVPGHLYLIEIRRRLPRSLNLWNSPILIITPEFCSGEIILSDKNFDDIGDFVICELRGFMQYIEALIYKYRISAFFSIIEYF